MNYLCHLSYGIIQIMSISLSANAIHSRHAINFKFNLMHIWDMQCSHKIHYFRYRERVNSRVKELIEAIEISLDNSTTMRHISLRSIRQYISLLIRLGRAKLVSTVFEYIINLQDFKGINLFIC